MVDSSRKDMQTLLKVTLALGSTVDLEKLLQLIVSCALELLDAQRGSVFLYDSKRKELYSKVATGTGEIRFSVEKGIAGASARQREIIHIPDAYADPRFNTEIDKETGFRTRAILSVPLMNVEGDLMGVMQVLNKHQGTFTDGDIELARAFAAQAGVGIQRAFLIEEQLEKQRMEHALKVASEIQQRLFPELSPPLRGFDISCWNRPCDATGGDYCDLLKLDEQQLLISMGDVTGHGVGPALMSCATRSMLRVLMKQGHYLETTLQTVNGLLNTDLPAGRFVTTFLGVLDAARRMLHYCSAGQGPLLWYRRSADDVKVLGADGIPLGILEVLEKLPPMELTLEVGDIFVLLTDGFYEWGNEQRELFGVERVCQVVKQNRSEKAHVILDAVRAAVENFSQTAQTDDLTAIVIKAIVEPA